MVESFLKYYGHCGSLEDLPVVSKSDLRDTFTESDVFCTSTNGTSGQRFSYKIWNKCFDYIETAHHYKQILDEFLINDNIITLKVSSNVGYAKEGFRKDGKFFIKVLKPPAKRHKFSHGAKSATCYYILYHRDDIVDFCKYLVKFLKAISIDVFLSSSSFFSVLMTVVNNDNPKIRIARLLSNTAEALIKTEADYAVENGNIDNYCDHMRSWDGGATFMTCRHYRYHIIDYLTYVEEVDGKLVSTDFLNLGTSFVRFWNGDRCRISNEWNICECGRYYRQFEFQGRNSFVWNNIPSIDIFDAVTTTREFTQCICHDGCVEIITFNELSETAKSKYRKIFKDVIFSDNFRYSNEKIERVIDARGKDDQNQRRVQNTRGA
jgi:phenylacetate-coenzyme A ligase PaaK-like adenylate-forming protein